MPRLAAAGVAKAFRPAVLFQRRLALGLDAEKSEKRGQRQAGWNWIRFMGMAFNSWVSDKYAPSEPDKVDIFGVC